ncbi:MAG: hypothetical protein VX768_08585 [Planctomycetota bacterium]|nr:hypothetical protein [Planctomycetota bacterium]
MYRTFLTTAALTAFFLTGCGSAKKEASNNSNNSGETAGATQGGETNEASESDPSGENKPAPGGQASGKQAHVGLQINFGQLMADEAVAAMMKSQPALPDFVSKMRDASIYVHLPDELMNATAFEFHAKLDFSDSEAAKNAYAMIFENAPAEDVQNNGKTYQKIAAPDAPVIFALQEGNALMVATENSLNATADSFATENLKKAMGVAPSDEPFKMAIDIAGAQRPLSILGLLAPQLEAVRKSSSLTTAGGGQGELLFMISIDAPDESTAKKVKQTVSLGVATVATALATQMPGEDVAPATSEFMNHVMSNLSPKQDGNRVQVMVSKPDNYDELKKKMPAEADKIQAKLMKSLGPGAPAGPGGGFGPGPGGPGAFPPGK